MFLVGGSGSGKSTISNIILRMYDISSGLILIDGSPIGSLSSKWLRENITVVEQQSVLFNTSIEDNILLGNADRDTPVSPEEMSEVIDFALLQDIIDTSTNGIDTVVGIGGSKLSGGQRQRIALARARIRDTPILILDESVSALDVIAREQIMNKIRAWRRNKTTIVITHELEQIRESDYVYVLADGRTVTHGLRANLTDDASFTDSAVTSPISPLSPSWPSARVRPQSDLASPFSDRFEIDENGVPSTPISRKRMTLPINLEDLIKTNPDLPPLSPIRNESVEYSRFTRASMLRPQSAFYFVPPVIESVDADNLYTHQAPPLPKFSTVQTIHGKSAENLAQGPALSSRFSVMRPISMGYDLSDRLGTLSRPKSALPTYEVERPKSAFFPGFSTVRMSVFVSKDAGGSLDDNEPKQDAIFMKYISSSDSAQFNVSSLHIMLMCYKSIPNKWLLWLGILMAVINGALTPVFSYTISQLISQMTPGVGSTGSQSVWIGVTLGISLLDGLTAFGRAVILSTVGDKWVKELRMKAMNSILQQDMDWYSRNEIETNDLTILIMSRVEDMRVLVTNLLSISATTLSVCLICVIWVLILGWKLCLVGLAMIPLFYLAAMFSKYIVLFWEAKCIYLNAVVEEIIHETVAGIRTLRILSLEKEFIKKFDSAVVKYIKAKYIDCVFSGLGFGVNEMVPLISQGILLWYGMKLIADHAYSAGVMLQVFTILFFGISSVGTLLTSTPQMHGIFLTSLRLFQIIDFKSELSHERAGKQSKIRMGKGNIVFSNVHFSYVVPEKDGDANSLGELNSKRQRVKGLFAPQTVSMENNLLVKVLNSFTAIIQCNKTTAIVGPSGSGKSTIVSLLTKLYAPAGGTIKIEGIDIVDIDTDILRQEIAVVGQMPLNFFGGTIYENITFALRRPITLEEVRAVCQECAIDEFISALPDGYNTRIGGSTGPISSGGTSLLSGGQMQRIGIARALVRQPRLLILDECTSGLDTKSTAAIKETLISYKQKRNMTILIITHQQDVAAIADNILTISDGKVVKRLTQ